MHEVNLIDKALEISIKAHEGQVDKAGVDYIKHPLYVASLVDTPEEKAVALLHDVVEDSQETPESLRDSGIPDIVIRAVTVLTKTKDEDYFVYLDKVKKNPLSRMVKLADLSHNLDINRIPNPNEKDMKRIKKYKRAVEYLHFR